jgi:hypothetical protein
MDGDNKLFFNEYFLQHSFINQVKLSKTVRKWRDFYNPYCKNTNHRRKNEKERYNTFIIWTKL